MKRILVVSGSRADYGLLEWPVKKLKEDDGFALDVLNIWSNPFESAFNATRVNLETGNYDLLLILGDRFEILAAATAAHLQRIPIAHIGGGDVTEGSYDDAMRDCISRMASIHFVTSTSAMARLSHMGYRNVHLVGNPGIDFIRHADWKKERPIAGPYVVVSYQAETIESGDILRNPRTEFLELHSRLPDVARAYFLPNPDRRSEEIADLIKTLAEDRDHVYEFLPHAEFLNLIAHCDEFIGNSSAMLYEAPELGIRTRMIGKRQRGRTIPWGDGFASERIVKILKYAA